MDHKQAEPARRSRDARVVRTRAALRAALVALLAEHELADITVQRIAAEARVGYATFFRHHAGVEALLIDVAEAMIAEFIDTAMPALLSSDRAAMLAALADYVACRRASVRALLGGGGETVRRELTAAAVARTAALPLEFDPALPRDLAVIHAVNSAINAIAWSVNQDATDNAMLGELVERLALKPLAMTGC